jgi:alpha-N-arabinofuranosidase
VRPESPAYETKRFGEVPLLHATAVRDEASGEVTIFAVNRSQTEPLPLEVALGGLGLERVLVHSVLADDDPDARNTRDEPTRVTPHEAAEGTTQLADGTLRTTLEPLSWNVIRLV